MRRRLILIILAIVAVLAITGGIVFAALTSTPASLTGHTWTLTRLVVSGQEQPLSTSRPPTLQFLPQERQISGSGGCNSYSAPYTIIGNQLRVGEMRVTLIACADNQLMNQEGQYLQALSRVNSYQIVGTTLTLTGDGGRNTLIFRAS